MPLTAAPPRAAPARTLVAELVGPAGAGKTAMLRAIAQQGGDIRAGAHIDRWRDLPVVLHHSIALLPIALEMLWRSPRAIRSALGQLIRLRTLPQVLEREMQGGRPAVVLDEGPLFALGRLSVFQGADQGNTRLAREWHSQLDSWARRLDIVVWLDAPDAVLADRIRSRPKTHRIKHESAAAITDFLGRYRSAYASIRARVTAGGHARMIDVDTGALSADQTASIVLGVLRPSHKA